MSRRGEWFRVEVLFDRVAGLDVGKASLAVCLRTPGPRGRRSETRTFKTTVGSLRVRRDWLVQAGVTIAAKESTSTYWKAPFYCLEEVMEVWLLNAAHMKAVPGRKTDVEDAEWIAQLLECGLLRPSMVPPPDIRRLSPSRRRHRVLSVDLKLGVEASVDDVLALEPDLVIASSGSTMRTPTWAAGSPTPVVDADDIVDTTPARRGRAPAHSSPTTRRFRRTHRGRSAEHGRLDRPGTNAEVLRAV
jgi:Transposase